MLPVRRWGLQPPPRSNFKVMAYNKKKIHEQAVKAISKNNLFFIEDVVAFLPCDKTTFYRFFPVDCNEYNVLRDMLEQNKIKTKSSIRAKLYKSEKAAELLALYRLICTPEEHRLLNQQYVENSGSVTNKIELDNYTEEEKEQLLRLARKQSK